jgi:hypothetical protein
MRVGRTGWVQVGDHDRNRRLRLIETLHQVALLLVNLLHLGIAVMLANLVEILTGTVE